MTESGKGFQLRVVNICNNNDSIIPLGIVNIVKGGYYAFELTENEILMTNLSYKMGVEKLHAVFRVGLGRYKEKSTFSYGFGLGSIMSVKGNHKINMELVCNNLNYDGEWKKLNLINQFDFNYQYQINGLLAVKSGTGWRTCPQGFGMTVFKVV